jgi:hypothetical protein
MSNIKLTELDFDNIKLSIINYMKSHPDKTFNTYDFEGSGLNTLIDLLAYNTHHQAFYLNMVANEMFLDTAKLRENVVSKSKLLGYIPKSNKSSTAIVDLIFKVKVSVINDMTSESVFINDVVTDINGNPKKIINNKFPINTTNVFTLNSNTGRGNVHYYTPKYVQYANRDKDIVYESPHDYYVYRLSNMELVQGNYVEEVFFINNEDVNQHNLISNQGIDTSSMVVTVSPSLTSIESELYTLEHDNMKLDSESNVYFLQESHNEQYEIYFGDGVLGKQPSTGSIVTVTYVNCLGSISNNKSGNMQWLTSPSMIPAQSISAKIDGKTWGGYDKDDIEMIKHAAPREFSTQRRAVTGEDYRQVLRQIYPNIDSINVWGGEEHIPPMYGRVLLSIKPKNSLYLSDHERDNIEFELKRNHSIIGIVPVLMSPTYIKININTLVKYDIHSTILSEPDIVQIVTTNIMEYSNDVLNSFGEYFRYSRFLSIIDDSNSSITNNVTTVSVSISYEIHESEITYEFKFSNRIKRGTVISTKFKLIGEDRYYLFSDDKVGNLVASTYDDGGNRYDNPYVIGDVDYDKGIVTVRNIILQKEEDITDITITSVLVSPDIYTRENQIVYIDVITLKVSARPNDIYTLDNNVHSVKIL